MNNARNDSPYVFEEHIVLPSITGSTTDGTSYDHDHHHHHPHPHRHYHADIVMRWNQQQFPVHPFHRLNEALNLNRIQKSGYLNMISANDDGGHIDYDHHHHIREVTMSVASQAGVVNGGSDSDKRSVYGHPSGFWLQILSERPISKNERQQLIDHWREYRILTTPLPKNMDAIWDMQRRSIRRVGPNKGSSTTRQASNNTSASETHTSIDDQNQVQYYDDNGNDYQYQIFLPTNGASWSADALQQLFSNLPCSLPLGVSAMEWSKLFVEGLTTDKHLQIVWKRQKQQAQQQQEVTLSLSFLPLVEMTKLPHSLFMKNSTMTCPLATRLIHESAESTKKIVNPIHEMASSTLQQVIRRPTSNYGRLETWFSSNLREDSSMDPIHSHVSNTCTFQLRQHLPYYFEPIWQSFQVIPSFSSSLSEQGTDDASYNNNNNKEDGISVQWNDQDMSSTILVTYPQTPSTLIMSLDYQPAFLSIDDFPGNPNRGRELPPAVVTIRCDMDTSAVSSSSSSNEPFQLFSNSVLILPPVPDMSMPFNVLSLSCSLYAYLIGTIMTLLVKRSSERIKYQLHPEQKPLSKFQKLKQTIVTKYQNVVVSTRRRSMKKNDTNNSLDENDIEEEEEKKPEAMDNSPNSTQKDEMKSNDGNLVKKHI